MALILLTIKPKVYHGLQELKCSGFCPFFDLITYYSLLALSASATLASLFMDLTSLELLYWLFSLPGPLFSQLSTWLFCSLLQVFAQMTPIMTFRLEVASTCHLTILTLPVPLTLPCFLIWAYLLFLIYHLIHLFILFGYCLSFPSSPTRVGIFFLLFCSLMVLRVLEYCLIHSRC